VIDTIAVADQQEAALNNHVPLAIIGIILLCTLVGAFLIEAHEGIRHDSRRAELRQLVFA
jgi:hypothetical protein